MMRRLRSAAGALALCVLLAVTAYRYRRRDAGQCAPAVGTGVCYVLQPMRPLSLVLSLCLRTCVCVLLLLLAARVSIHSRLRARALALSL